MRTYTCTRTRLVWILPRVYAAGYALPRVPHTPFTLYAALRAYARADTPYRCLRYAFAFYAFAYTSRFARTPHEHARLRFGSDTLRCTVRFTTRAGPRCVATRVCVACEPLRTFTIWFCFPHTFCTLCIWFRVCCLARTFSLTRAAHCHCSLLPTLRFPLLRTLRLLHAHTTRCDLRCLRA